MRRHQVLLLLLLMSIPIHAVRAQGKSTTMTKGPFAWSNDCGQMEVTLTLDTKQKGLYTWDYAVHNISLHSIPEPAVASPVVDGILNFQVYAAPNVEVPELGGKYFRRTGDRPESGSLVIRGRFRHSRRNGSDV